MPLCTCGEVEDNVCESVLFLYHVRHRAWTPVWSPWLQVALSAAPSHQALYQPLNHSFCFYLWIRFSCQFILPLPLWPCNIVEIILFNSEPSRFPSSCCVKVKVLTVSCKTWRDGTLPSLTCLCSHCSLVSHPGLCCSSDMTDTLIWILLLIITLHRHPCGFFSFFFFLSNFPMPVFISQWDQSW